MSNAIKIYPAEFEAGLGEKIASQRSVTSSSRLGKPEGEKFIIALDEAIAKFGEDNDSFDLYPTQTIMVSTGWNENHDIFANSETWAARHSPVHKPFNFGHTPRQIIGHIISCIGMDTDYNIIPDDTPVEKLPNKFHLVTGAVIYRFPGCKRDPELTKEMAELIAGIERGDWFVSMECLFDGFDYGTRDESTGALSIIPRREDTAFLTKHLRAFGGTGKYNGYTIGRILKGITFSGKGLVENPANKDSIFIFNNVSAFNATVASEETITKVKNQKGHLNMDTQILELQKQLTEANQKILDMGEAEITAKIASKDAEIAKRDEQIASLTTKVDELTAAKAVEAELTTKLTEATAKLAEIEANAKKTGRISTLVDKGVDKADAEKLVDKFEGMADEQFSEIVAMQAELAIAKKVPATPVVIPEPAAAPEGEETKTPEEAALETVEEVVEPDLATASETPAEQKQESQAALSEFLGSWLAKNKKSKN